MFTVFTWNHLPVDSNGEIADIFLSAPDWTIEILSPDQRPAKVTKKILRCLEQGTQIGWLIDPQDKSVSVYQPQKAIVLDMAEEANVRLPLPNFMNNLTLIVSDLFGLLMV